MNTLSVLMIIVCLINLLSYGMETTPDERIQKIANIRLLHAATMGNVVEIKQLIEQAPVNVNTKNRQGCTPLYLACFNNKTDAAYMLIQAGADVNSTNDNHETPLICAVNKCNKDLVSALIAKQANVNVYDELGNNILVLAIEQVLINAHVLDIVSALVNAGSQQKEKALLYVAGKNYKSYNCRYDKKEREQRNSSCFEIIKVLIKAHTNINTYDTYKFTPLIHACFENNLDAAQLFIEAGADVNSKDRFGNTAFTYALNNSNPSLLGLLIKAEAEIYEESDAISALSLMISCEYFSTAMNIIKPRTKYANRKKIETFIMFYTSNCSLLSELPKEVLKVIITFAYPEYAMDISTVYRLDLGYIIDTIPCEALREFINNKQLCLKSVLYAWESKIEYIAKLLLQTNLCEHCTCIVDKFKKEASIEIMKLLEIDYYDILSEVH